jgi:hypothetical protein
VLASLSSPLKKSDTPITPFWLLALIGLATIEQIKTIASHTLVFKAKRLAQNSLLCHKSSIHSAAQRWFSPFTHPEAK